MYAAVPCSSSSWFLFHPVPQSFPLFPSGLGHASSGHISSSFPTFFFLPVTHSLPHFQVSSGGPCSTSSSCFPHPGSHAFSAFECCQWSPPHVSSSSSFVPHRVRHTFALFQMCRGTRSTRRDEASAAIGSFFVSETLCGAAPGP